MHRKIACFLAFCLFCISSPLVFAVDNNSVILEADAKAVAPKSSIDEDFVLAKNGPNGSEIVWEAEPSDLFDSNGKYMPKIGSGKLDCTLKATLSYNGMSLTKTYTTVSYRQPKYKINGFLYEKPDGFTVRHMLSASRIIAAEVEKNPRVEDDAVIVVAAYTNGKLQDISSANVEESGMLPLDCEISGDAKNTELKCYLWDGLSGCVPLEVPKEQRLSEVEENSFFNTNTAITDSGDDASQVVDSDEATEYRFSDTPDENPHATSLYLYRASANGGQPTVRYPLEQIGGKLVFEIDFLMTESELEKGLMYLYDQNSTIVFSLIIVGDSIEDNKNHSAYKGLLPYRWYHVKAEVDTDTKKADVYVNGEIGYNDMPFRNASSEISRIQIHNSAGGESGFYVDNILITDDGAECLNENFNSCVDGALPDGWSKSNAASGAIRTEEFKDTYMSIYPQTIIVDTERYANLESVTVDIPDGMSLQYYIEASTDNATYVRVASHITEAVSGKVKDYLDTVQMRYLKLCIRSATDSNGKYCNAAVKEISLEVSKKHGGENVAPLAHVSISSKADVSYDGRGLIDGIVARFARRGEWNASGEANPKAYLSWDEPQTVDTVELFGRLTEEKTVDGVELLFDDGEKITVDEVPASGLPVSVEFEPKTVNWIRLRLLGAGANAGLSEVQVLKSGEKTETVSYLLPWKTVAFPADYSGYWIVSDDIDGDGSVEFVSARGRYEYSSHETVAACAVDISGNVLWTWGTAGAGQHSVGSDIACQIYDLDNDGTKEVLLSTKTQLIILNGKTGEQKAAYDLPTCSEHPDDWASDCIIIADISGKGYPSDIIVKTRYTDVWAYTKDWEIIWHHCMPNDMKTAHAPEVIDIDHDGKDEIFAGFCFVDDDGEIISALNKTEFTLPLSLGHVDSFAVLNFDDEMPLSEMRFAVSPCGANDFFVIDGTGKKLWESSTDMHYETLIAGKFTQEGSCVQLATNPALGGTEPIGGSGYNPIYIYNADSAPTGDGSCEETEIHWGFTTNRYLYAVNMTGGEYDYIYQPSDHILVDGKGKTRVRLVSSYRDSQASMRWEAFCGYHNDIDGDGTQDIVSLSRRDGILHAAIYQNPNGKITATKAGTGYNYTFY